MKLDELYEIKVESYRDFRNHLMKGFTVYIVVLGALVKFALDAKATNGGRPLFLALWIILVAFLVLALILSFFYVRHARLTAAHVERLSQAVAVDDRKDIKIQDYAEDGLGMRAAMITFASLNGLALLSSVIWLVVELLR